MTNIFIILLVLKFINQYDRGGSAKSGQKRTQTPYNGPKWCLKHLSKGLKAESFSQFSSYFFSKMKKTSLLGNDSVFLNVLQPKYAQIFSPKWCGYKALYSKMGGDYSHHPLWRKRKYHYSRLRNIVTRSI